MSPDLRLATIYVMPLGGKDVDEVLAALERNKKFLRGEIAHRVNLKFAPEIRFRKDERFEEAERIEKILATPQVQARFEAGSRRVIDSESNRTRTAARMWSPTSAGTHEDAARSSAQAREARRARLDRARQAGRHDVDPRGRGHQAAVLGEARRTRRHARSARLGRAADRARRGDQDRSVRDGRPQVLPLHRALGRGARHRRFRRPRDRHASDARPDQAAISALLPQFTGPIMQIPPQFSAIKIDGERAYDLARDGQVVDLQPRPVDIHALRLVETPDPDHAVFEAECGKGTYVRALARDMGRALGLFRPCLRVAPDPGRVHLPKKT